MAKSRIYLHPVVSKQKVNIKHYRRQKQATTADGVRLTHFTATPDNKVVNPHFKSGIMAELPDGQTLQIFGPHDQISNVVKELESDPGAVYRSLRFAGQSSGGNYYLNSPAPAEPQNELSPAELDQAATPHKLFPNQGSEDYPRTMQMEERQAAKAHVREIAEKKYGGTHPSSADGQAAVEAAVNRAEGGASNTTIIGAAAAGEAAE